MVYGVEFTLHVFTSNYIQSFQLNGDIGTGSLDHILNSAPRGIVGEHFLIPAQKNQLLFSFFL